MTYQTPERWENVTFSLTEPGEYHLALGHSLRSEIVDLRDDILQHLDQIEGSPGPSYDELEAFSGISLDYDDLPDTPIVPFQYSYNIVALFAISTGVMELQAKDILFNELIDEEHKTLDFHDEFRKDCTLYQNLDLARQLNLIDNGVFGMVNDVREYRNEIVHEPSERLFIDSYQEERDRVNKAVKAPDKLNEILND